MCMRLRTPSREGHPPRLYVEQGALTRLAAIISSQVSKQAGGQDCSFRHGPPVPAWPRCIPARAASVIRAREAMFPMVRSTAAVRVAEPGQHLMANDGWTGTSVCNGEAPPSGVVLF